MTQKIIKVGDSIAVTIPKDAAKQLNIKAGDEVAFVLHEGTGSIAYTPVKKHTREFNHQEKVVDLTLKFINRYRDDLDALKDK